MKKSLIILCLAFITSPVFADAGWKVSQNGNSIYFDVVCPGGTFCWYRTCSMGSYQYSNGQWTRAYYQGTYTTYSCCAYLISDCYYGTGCCWGCAGSTEDQRKAAHACALIQSGWIPQYLNMYWPQGGTDPDFDKYIEYTLEFADPNIPPIPSAYDNDTNPATGGDPVYLSNGEYNLSVTDLSVAGRALPLEITRTYGSRRECNGRFGYGWDMSFHMKVRRLATDVGEPNSVMLLDGKGNRRQYTQQDGADPNLYLNPADLSDYLYERSNLLTLVKRSGIEYEFDAPGNLAKITDKNGNSINFSYNPLWGIPVYGFHRHSHHLAGLIAVRKVIVDYRLDNIIDDLGRQIHLAYNDAGRLSTITDFAGRTWTYTYDDISNDLIAVEDPNSGVTTYTYDYRHNLTSITDPNGLTYMENTYADDVNDVVTDQVYGYGTYVYDYSGLEKEAFVIDREGYEKKVVYNAAGQTVSETIYTADPDAEPNSFTTQFLYDPDTSEMIRSILPNGACVDYTYDDLVNLTGVYRKTTPGDPNSRNDPNVIATTFTYDATHIYDVNSITDPMGNTTYFEFDPNGNVIQVTYPAVAVHGYAQPQTPIVTYTYNSHGQVDTMTAPDGIVTRYLYYSDANPSDPNCGKLWKTIADYNAVEGLNFTTEYAYDVYGNIREITDPNGDKARMTYNELHLLTKTVSPLGKVTLFTYNPNKKVTKIEREIAGPNQVTSFTYDLLDHVRTTTNPLGYVTHYGYTKSEEPNLVTDAESHSTVSLFNERGLLAQVLDANDDPTSYTHTATGDVNDVQDAKGNKTLYEYDRFGRLTYTIYPDTSFEAFVYDKNSNLLSRTQRNGDTIGYEYDAMNRLRVKSRPNEPNLVYTYDIAGRIYDVNDAGQITEYYYDRVGRIVDVNDPEDRLVSYEYDSRGLRTKLTYPDNSYITYEYDAESKLQRIKDDNSNLLAEYGYDDLGRRSLLTLGNDANVVYEYDLANRLTKLTNNLDDVNALVFAYDNYDRVGNRLSMQIDDANEHVYSYDPVYRLTYVDYNDGNDMSFVYDALGNRHRTINGGTVSYQSNNLNQYTAVGGTSHTYDDNGNLAFDGQFRYYYDCENRLIDVNDANDAPVASYAYDYQGRRISRTIYGAPDVTTQYAYDGSQIIAEYDGSGTLLRKFVYGPGIDEPICLIDAADANAVYYYHVDGQGSVVALCDVNSVSVERYAYDVFGRPTIRDASGTVIEESAFGNPYLFTGRAYDAETALYYYRARYYDYYTGRFLQPDPIGYDDGLNLYQYCLNNPLLFVDPWGLCKETVGDPGLLGSLIPIYGSGRTAINAFQEGRYGSAAFNGAMAVTDVFAVKALVTAAGKLIIKGGAKIVAKVGARRAAGKAAANYTDDALRAGGNGAVNSATPPKVSTDGFGNIGGGATTAENALTQGEKYLGPGYREISPGVYRSADGTRQFRMTTSDLIDPKQGPHVHFEAIGPDGRTIVENSHVTITP